MKANKQIFLALGTNLGDLQQNIQIALTKLQKIIKIRKTSSIYKTEPVGYAKQGWFYNMVLEAETTLNAANLLQQLQQIENSMGKNRIRENGPRIIDIDILIYQNLISKDPKLQIPHPQIPNRGFVLHPFAEIAPNFLHPELQVDIKTLLSKLKDEHKVQTT